MSDLLKVVNPAEVAAYGTRINNRVDEIFATLNQLIVDVVDVDYHGTNAFRFKTEAGQQATAFAKSLQTSINELKTGVSGATSNIAGALGGSPITINLSDNAITPQTPAADTGTQIADPTALTTLVTTIGTRFDSLETSLNGLRELPANDRSGWMGQARNDTESYVNGWVTSAKSACTTAREGLVNYVNEQNAAVRERDRV